MENRWFNDDQNLKKGELTRDDQTRLIWENQENGI